MRRAVLPYSYHASGSHSHKYLRANPLFIPVRFQMRASGIRMVAANKNISRPTPPFLCRICNKAAIARVAQRDEISPNSSDAARH